MTDNVDSDNAYEVLQHLIVSSINSASKSPSSDSSEQGIRDWSRKKQIRGKSWTCSGIIITDILLHPVAAAGDGVDMSDESDQSNPLDSRLPIIKSLLQSFMRPIFFPQDSLLEPFGYLEVYVECTSLLAPRRGSTFHVDFRAFLQSSMQKTVTALIKLIPVSSTISLSWALCEGGLGQNDYYQACISQIGSNPWSSLFSLGKMVPNTKAISLERKKRKVSSSTIT